MACNEELKRLAVKIEKIQQHTLSGTGLPLQ